MVLGLQQKQQGLLQPAVPSSHVGLALAKNQPTAWQHTKHLCCRVETYALHGLMGAECVQPAD